MSGQFEPLSREPPPTRALRTDALPEPEERVRRRSGDGERPRVDGVAPARGLMLGVAIGAVLWIGIFALAWRFFR